MSEWKAKTGKSLLAAASMQTRGAQRDAMRIAKAEAASTHAKGAAAPSKAKGKRRGSVMTGKTEEQQVKEAVRTPGSTRTATRLHGCERLS